MFVKRGVMWNLEGTKQLVFHIVEFEFGNLAETFQSIELGIGEWEVLCTAFHEVEVGKIIAGTEKLSLYPPTYDLPTRRSSKLPQLVI
jgi:hypothetical protein